MDFSLIRELIYFFQILTWIYWHMLVQMFFPWCCLFRVEITVNDQITVWGSYLNFPPWPLGAYSTEENIKFCSVQKTRIKICNYSHVLLLTFNQIKKENNAQLKCQFNLACHHHGPYQPRETRAQQTQYFIHQFQTGLHIFFRKDRLLVFHVSFPAL